jgi:hypothetical protein
MTWYEGFVIESLTVYPIDDDGHLTGDRCPLRVRLLGVERLPADPPTEFKPHSFEPVIPQPNTGFTIHLINPTQTAKRGPYWDWHQRCTIEVIFRPAEGVGAQAGHLFPLVDRWSPIDRLNSSYGLMGETLRHHLAIGPHLPRWHDQSDLVASGRSYGYSHLWALDKVQP